MKKYDRPIVTAFSANDIRAFKAAAVSCISGAVTCGTAGCTTTSQNNSCQSNGVHCTTAATPR